METGTTKILAENDQGIGWLTFNQPEGDPGVRVVVLRGAGDKAFTAGADISEFDAKRADAAAAEEYRKIPEAGRVRMAAFRKPLIAMIRGFCMGGGLGVAMRADLRVAASDAIFGIPAGRLGLAYAFESLRSLTDRVGPANAQEILFTAHRLGADEALRIGLVTAWWNRTSSCRRCANSLSRSRETRRSPSRPPRPPSTNW